MNQVSLCFSFCYSIKWFIQWNIDMNGTRRFIHGAVHGHVDDLFCAGKIVNPINTLRKSVTVLDVIGKEVFLPDGLTIADVNKLR